MAHSDHGLPLWLSMSYILPDLVAQPFTIFGTLAIAESQERERLPEKRDSSLSRSRSRTRPRTMTTSSLTSVLSLYRKLPNAMTRILKASLVNMIADRLIAWPCAWFTQRLLYRNTPDRHPIRTLLLTGVFEAMMTLVAAPFKLLGTELTVFNHFDWRFLQMNSKALPIVLPNLANALTSFLLYQLSDLLLDNFNDLINNFTDVPSVSIYKLATAFVMVLSSTIVLFGAQAIVEVWRVNADLLVLNGNHTIIPITEVYEGSVMDLSGPNYSIIDTLRRYARVCFTPTALCYLLAGFTAPLIGQFSEVSLHRAMDRI